MVGTVLNSRYRLDQLIGTGGMADVYRAYDTLLGRVVAVKILHPQYAKDPVFIERFRQEAQAAAHLNQPNIVNVYDWGIEDNVYFLVMEYVEGFDLKDIIVRGGPLLPERAVEIAAAICGALEAAHASGIVHRDIKPQNIIVTPDNQVKVMDFGIARATGGSAMTQTGTIMGTAQYISPEQAQGRAADPRSDLYSLGVVIYEMLTAKVPFDGDNPVAIAYKHVREDPLPPSMINPDVSPELEAVVMKALSKNPENRYQNALELKADLERCLEGAPVFATPVLSPDEARGGAQAFRTPHRSRAWIWIIVAIVALAGIGVGIWAIVNATSGVEVPNLVGQSVTAADKLLKSNGLALGNVTQSFDQTVAKDQIVSQSPPAGAKVSKGVKVDVVVSKGPSLVAVPKVTGQSQETAAAAIAKAGLKVGNVTSAASNSVAAGTVISQDPAADTQVAEGSPVSLVVSKGQETAIVPNVVGMTTDAARQALEAKGLTATVQEVTDASKTAGVVFEQDPAADVKVAKGSKVTIKVAIAPVMVNVPNVKGQTQAAAQSALTSAGFLYTVTGTPAPTPADKNMVKDQSPAAGTSAVKGSTVVITVYQ